LRLVVSEEIEDADFAVARNHSQPKSAARAKSGANSGPVKPDDSPPTVEQVRELVQECAALPDHIRAAMLALLGTVWTANSSRALALTPISLPGFGASTAGAFILLALYRLMSGRIIREGDDPDLLSMMRARRNAA
jgi:hypothetical protein